MKRAESRRAFLRLVLCLVGTVCTAVGASPEPGDAALESALRAVQPADPLYELGKHYAALQVAPEDLPVIQTLRAQYPGKVLVIECFSYACHGCAALQGLLPDWRLTLPPTVTCLQLPVVWDPSWEPLAHAFYVLQGLHAPPATHQLVFDAVFRGEQLGTDAEVLEFLQLLPGQDWSRIAALYHAFGVTRQVERARELMRALQASSVPRWFVIGPQQVWLIHHSAVRSFPELLAVVRSVATREAAP